MTIHKPIWLEGAEALSDPMHAVAPRQSVRALGLIAVATIAMGIASSLLIGWAIGSQAPAAVFGGLVLAAAAVAFATAMGRSSNAPAVATDWSLVRGALEATKDPVAVTDAQGRLISANSAWAERSSGIVASLLELEPQDGAGRLSSLMEEATRNGIAHHDVAIRSDAGRPLSLMVRQLGGVPSYYLWSLQDTPQARVRANAVDMIAGQVGDWLSQAGVMAATVDGEGRILAANRALEASAGNPSAKTLIGAPLTDLLDLAPDGTVCISRPGGTPRQVRPVELALTLDDTVADTHVFLLLDEGDGERALIDAARSAEGHQPSIDALLSTLPLGIALADRDGRFQFINAAFRRAASIEDGEEPLYPSDLVIEDDKAMVADMLRRIATGHVSPRDLRIRLKGAPEEPVVLTLARFTGLGRAAVVLFLKDNSEQEKLERQVAQATKMQAVGQLAGGVAHDFNNILTAVIGYCDLMLLRHSPGDSDFDDITQIKQNANRAANLVRQLLAFSRQQTLRMQVLQLSDVVGELSHLLKRLLGETITLTVNYGRNLGAVRADPGQLEQVIVNLAVNARDAMPEGGELTIETFSVSAAESRRYGADVLPPADYTGLRVRDTGTGIPEDVLGKIFEPFFTTKEVGKGTGLGLSTVYGIVKQTGGYIFAESAPDRGTEFLIYFPVHAADQQSAAAPARSKAQGNDLWGIGTVLLVEDEATVRAVAERALSRKGYRVLTAGNGEEALEVLARGEEIDLLVSDVVMPVMDGPTLVAKARETLPHLPIVFMSGYAEEQLRKSIEIPGFAFLPKPFSVQQLAEAVRDALSNVQTTDS